jgi:hypothetical protein
MRTKKKALETEVSILNRRIANLEQRSYKMLEVLKASGIIEALEEGEDMITIPYHGPFGTLDNHYKINEVF